MMTEIFVKTNRGVEGKFALSCGVCQKEYFVPFCRREKSKFCSRVCQVRGQVWTQERKDKIGKGNSGPRMSIRGSKNYNWKGGSLHSVRRMVLERDQQTCQCASTCGWHIGKICGFSDPYIMHVDHKKPKKLFPELRLVLDNLITVCPNCHQRKTNMERRNKIFKKTI